MIKPVILVVGSAQMELSLNMARIPERGETLVDDGGVAYLPSGSAVDLSVALTKLGACAVPVTKLGADAHGKKLYDFMKGGGLDVSAITVDRELSTALCVRMRDGAPAERRLYYPGATSAIGADMLRHAFDLVCPTAVLISLDIPFESALCAARIAESRGIPILLDGRGACEEHLLEQMPQIEIFLLNEKQAKQYTGILPMGADVSLRSALVLYKKMNLKYVLFKLGARGSFLYDGKRRDMVSPVAGCRVPDGPLSIGACYTAALCAAYLAGTDIRSSMHFATAAAALCIQNGGGMSAFPTAPQVLDFRNRRMACDT